MLSGVRLAWMTDIHFDFLEPEEIDEFFAKVRDHASDGVLVSGDIAVARILKKRLEAFASVVQKPIWFVLGNHDYYGSRIAPVRTEMQALTAASPFLKWMPAAGIVPLTKETAIVGHDGWGDGKLGNGRRSQIRLNDHIRIKDFQDLDGDALFDRLEWLGKDAADHFARVLPDALARFPHVLVLTHVPPFREACWHEGKISDDEWLPHFTCAAVGEVLLEAMRGRPDRRMSVLCGHTHGRGEYRPLPNLVVRTGAAEYGFPALQEDVVVP